MSVLAFGLPVPKETGGRQMRVKRVQCTQKVKIPRETACRLPVIFTQLARYVPVWMRYCCPGTYDERFTC